MKSAWFFSLILVGIVFSADFVLAYTEIDKYIRDDLCQRDISSVIIVNNFSPSLEKEELWDCNEVWHIGGGEEGDVPLSFITSVICQDSMVYILDSKDSKIYVLTLDGICTSIFDVSGEGPGQCSKPSNLLAIEKGLFGLVRVCPGKIILTYFEGYYPPSPINVMIGEFDHGIVGINGIRKNSEYFLIYTETLGVLDRNKVDIISIEMLSEFGMKGQEINRYFYLELDKSMISAKEMLAEIDIPHYAQEQCFVIDEDGSIYVASYRDKYWVYCFTPDGKLRTIITRDYQSRPREEEEFFLAGYYGVHAGRTFTIKAEKNEPDILSLDLVDGRILVRNSRSKERKDGLLYDVFNRDGEFISQLFIKYPNSDWRDELVFLEKGLIAVIKGNFDTVKQGAEEILTNYVAEPVQVILYRY